MEGTDPQTSIALGFGHHCRVGGPVDYLLPSPVMLLTHVTVFIQAWRGPHKGHTVLLKSGVAIRDSDGETLRPGNRDQTNCCLYDVYCHYMYMYFSINK